MHFRFMIYTQEGPCLTLPVCFPMDWVPIADLGDRAARQRLEAGCMASLGPAWQWVATCRQPLPVLPLCLGDTHHCPWPWLLAPVLPMSQSQCHGL